MATKLSPSTPRSKLHRGSGLEADRTPPLVKTTSSMFAENSPKRRTLVSRGTELSQVQEELAKTKEQLALTEKSKANLLQDLARSKRHVEDLTAKLQDATEVSKKDRMRAEEMEHASFTAAEDWQVEVEVMREQYEAAILQLEANKQTMDCLRHEMIMCMEAKNEAVRLAGEAMNAAESTALRVEDLSAELLAARKAMVAETSVCGKGGGELKREDSCLQHDINEVAAPCEESSQEKKAALSPVARDIELNSSLQESMGARFDSEVLKGDEAVIEKPQMHLTDPKSAVDCLQAELRLSQEGEMASELQLISLSFDLDRLTKELTDAKEVESRLKSQILAMSSAVEQAERQLADANQAEKLASEAARNANENFSRASAEIERMKESESATLASLFKVSTELSEAHEKLTRVGLEEAVFEAFLESLKLDLASKQVQLASMEKKEASSRSKAESISLELKKLTEEHQKEAQLFNEKLIHSNAAMESLRLEFDRQKVELASAMQRELALNENVEAFELQLKQTQDMVTDLKRQEMEASERGSALLKELEISQKDLLAAREEEMRMTYKIGSLMDDLEAKKMEVSELCRRVASAEKKAVSVSVDLECSLLEVLRLRDKEVSMDSKAAALSVALASLSEATESKLVDLKEKEKIASVKAAALHEELRRRTSEFEKTLTDARVAREDVDKLYESLKMAGAERDQAKRQEQIAVMEATQSRQAMELALAEARKAKYEMQKALEAAQMAEQKALQGAQEAEAFEEKLQAAENEVLSRKSETEAVRQQLKAASEDIQKMSEELEQERQEAQLVRQEVVGLKAELVAVKRQAMAATEENEAAKKEMEKLRELVEEAKSVEEEAQGECRAAENLLQDALIELAALKLQGALPIQDGGEKLKYLSSTPHGAGASQEKFMDLNMKLQEAEKHLAMVTAPLEEEASMAITEILSSKLDASELEKKGHENTLLDSHQLLADAEKAEMNIEAEIQRQLDKSKQQQAMKDAAIDSQAHTEVNSRSFSFDCREDKPQPDFGEEGMILISSPLKMSCRDGIDEPDKGIENGSVGSKEELLPCSSMKQAESPEHDEGSVKDEGASQDESASLPSLKKKKKNLLGRLGTLLDKKKHLQQQTP